MRKKCFRYLIIFLICSVSVFLYTWYRLGLSCDEIWNYGVAYSMSKGLIPYKDFNLLTGPLYPFLGSIFIKIFSHHLYSFEIFNSVIVGLMALICYFKLNKNFILLFLVMIFSSFTNYNVFCLFLLLLVININESNFKYKEFYIGFLIGCIFITKQTIGICLVITMVLFNKQRKKLFLSFLIPCFLLGIYLVYNNAFLQFIDYCFLGLIDFGSNNCYFNPFYVFLWLILVIYLIYKIFKTRFKDISLLYVFTFQCVAYPIFNYDHFSLGFLALLYYIILRNEEVVNKNFKYYLIMSITFFITFITNPVEEYRFYNDSSSFMNGKAIFGELSSYDNCISILKKYVNNVKDNYDYVFIFSDDIAYAVKLDIGYKLSKFDMIANGNMGYNGSKRLREDLNKICLSKTCIFLVDDGISEYLSQTNIDIIKYVKNNYKEIDGIDINDFNDIDRVLHFSVYNNLK